MDWVYIDDTHQYFVAIDYEGSKTLYRSDVNRNHVEVILPNFEYGTVIHYAKGDTLYMTTLHYQENQAATSQFGIYDCKSQEFTPMKGFEDIDVVGVSDNQTLIYRKQVDSHQEYWKTELSFVKPERMSELEDIIATAHPEACASNVVSQMVIISRPNITADKHLKPVILYHIETGKSMNLENIDHSSKLQFSGDYVYYTKSLTSSEMSASPHKDYFHAEVEVEVSVFQSMPDITETYIVKCQNKSAGRIYRTNLLTMEEECVLDLTYHDVPVWIQEFGIDGNVCYLIYATHEDYVNHYNPTLDHHITATPEYPYKYRLAVADFSNGTLTFVDDTNVDAHE